MHNRDELSCSVDRGYELWLLQQAKARNPDIQTFALSWAVPRWVGNGSYFSADNQAYQTAFAACVRSELGFALDYIGIWNERAWGSEDYVLGLRAALDASGFNAMKIVLPDGYGAQVTSAIAAAATNATFNKAVHAIGVHYPCTAAEPEANAEGLAYWASEDYSTVADWAGAGCWGRSLVENYVRLNATSTVAWSLIWSVYPQLPYFGNGLMYAYEPWSGQYEVNAALWTSAHWTQFSSVGWRFLSVAGGGSGFLPGGGAYVTLVPPGSTSDFTLILETLQGDCLRCKGGATAAQNVTVRLTGGLPGAGTVLHVWATNVSAPFVRQPDVTVGADGTFTVFIDSDSMVTVTTLSGGQHGAFPSSPIPPSAPFPLPYADDFSGYPEDSLARYMSDQAGSFAVRGGALHQVVAADPGPNAWVGDNDPITLFGDAGWSDVTVSVTAAFNDSAAGQPGVPRVSYTAPSAAVGVDAAALVRTVPERLRVGAHSPVSLGAPTSGASVAPCDASSPHQQWTFNLPSQGYLSNAAGAPGVGGAACLNLNGCASDVIYYDCVTSGGTCAGPNSYTNLQWAYDATTGALTSALNGDCVTWTAGNASMSVLPCTGAAAQKWVYSAASGSLQLGSTGLCLATPAPATYVTLCARITGYSGFTIQTVPGYCMSVNATGGWAITAGPKLGAVASGSVSTSVPGWSASVPQAYALVVNGNSVSAVVGGVTVGGYVDDDATYQVGMAALGSGYHYAVFDDLGVKASSSQ